MLAFWNRPARPDPACTPQPASGRPTPPAQPLTQALDLDARTDWPTHRIRSFLSMHASGAPGRSSR